MDSLLRCLYDLATESIVGKIMYKFDKQCNFYIFVQGSTYLFVIFYASVKLCGCHGIWDLKFDKYWEECNQLSDTHVIVKGLNPGVISKVGGV